MKVELPQLNHKLGEVGNNLKLIIDALESSDADLLIFPELFLTGYLCRDKLNEIALSLDDKYVEDLRSAARKANSGLIFGMPELSSKIRGQLFNTAVYIDPSGKIDVYRKLHMVNFGPFEEQRYFTSGKEVHLMRFGDWKFGIVICYDIFFPELTKFYALQGADMVICISAAPSTTIQFFHKVMVARAIENTIFFLYSNLMGTEKNLVFTGGNVIVGPRGEVKAKGKDFEIGSVKDDIELSEIKIARENRPTLRDTRFDLFKAVVDSGKIDSDEIINHK